MSFYRTVLDTLFRTLSGDHAPKVLALTWASPSGELKSERRHPGAFAFPDSLLPSLSDHRALSDGESFVDEAISAVETSGAKCIFACPPLRGNSRLSEEFRGRYRHLGIVEAVATAMASESQDAPRIVAVLLPTQELASLRTVTGGKSSFPHTARLLERNAIRFVGQREKLAALGMPTKKGLLFYGPPGTGKTHTIHYLARGISGQTTFLVTAEQVGMLGDYMTLARLFQPSMVVIEDVDLIARDRASMHTPGEEVLLNKLLNEMDGLKPETDILFVLTTNRPEKLEAALSSRPGRIDQAIEFPYPDEAGRAKLIRLYSKRVEVPDEVAAAVVKKTERVSASFIKELMRRATQYYLEREAVGPLRMDDAMGALEEMMFQGGSLNRVLLGAAEAVRA